MEQTITRYSIQHDRKIKKICEPLEQHLGFSVFTYYTIDANGTFGILSSFAEQLEFYFDKNCHISEPYLRHPHLFRSGQTEIPAIADPNYKEHCSDQYQLDHMFIKLQRTGDILEGFLFASRKNNRMVNFLHYVDLFHQFGLYFKTEAGSLIERMKEEGFNLKQAKGDAFFSKMPHLPLSATDPRENAFIQSISPLSKRERECLDLFKRGHSAQTTGAILGISQRTVESYFNNIKSKLGCDSKWNLLDF